MDSAIIMEYKHKEKKIYKYRYEKKNIYKKFAGRYTVDLINIKISRNVQEECANRLYMVFI